MKPLSPKDPKEIGGFTLVGRLGAGGMGVVYLASRKSDSVALKVIRESLIDDEVEASRFTREISTLEKIQSPHVARILETGIDDGRAWFAVEFVNGPNLSELVQDKGPLDEGRWWELAHGLLRGLSDVHDAGVLHRDIKPANVIMAATGPKLIDFGIAHVSDATSVTATGLVAGSPAWFSPEQIEGLELTTATDVFSAGSLLTFAATGSSPWGGATTMTKASVFKILTSEPDMEGLDAEQGNLVSKMLEKEPRQRATAESLLENLDAIRAGKKVELNTAGAAPRPKGTDATTTVERSLLEQAIQSAASSSGNDSTETSAHTPPGLSSKARRHRKGSATLVALSAVLLFSSSGEIATKEAWPIPTSSGSGEIATKEDCVEEQLNTAHIEGNDYMMLFGTYALSLTDAKLDTAFFNPDGTRSVPSLDYATWASRAGDLVSFMQSDLQTAQSASTHDPATQSDVNQIVEAHVDLTNAWADLRSASQRESESAFLESGQRIGVSEDLLYRLTYGTLVTRAQSACAEIVD